MNKHFIPVKITDKKWADKLVNGEVYMRALHEFGSWGNVTEKDTVLNNNYRGDFFAGVTATYRTADDSDFFRGFPTEVKAHMANCCLVDESDVQFFKIFSLYRHELDEEKQEFVAPDPRMAQFGNTAVLITDFCEFIERYGKAMFAAYDKVISMIGNVEPFNFRETRNLNPLFCKHESQAYQKELRMVFGEVKKDVFARGPGAEDAYELKILLLDYELQTARQTELKEMIEKKIEEVPYAEKLQEIKGVGLKTVIGFVAEVGDIKRFDDSRQLQKLAGLAIVKNESGKHKGESHISYRGRKRLRYVLYEAAISVIAHNPEFKSIHHYYTTRHMNPLKKMQSLIAVACKLIRIFYLILKTGVTYNPSKMIGDIRRPAIA